MVTMMMLPWLLFCHAPNGRDMRQFESSLDTMQHKLSSHGAVYTIVFGPTISSDCQLWKITKFRTTKLMILSSQGLESVIPNIDVFVDYLLKIGLQFRAIAFWMHGASFAAGPWKRWKKPFINIVDTVNHLIVPFQPELVCFDACYQGGMSCLYELPKCVRVVLASPAFHPFISIIETSAFGKLKSDHFQTKTSLLKYAHSINCQWNDLTSVRWKCLMVFDMMYIPDIALLCRQNLKKLHLIKANRIDKEDSNLLDLYTCASDVPELQILIELSVANSCKRCMAAVTSRVKGMSIEGRLPGKWIQDYVKTKWYKDVVRYSSRFSLR